KHGSVCLADFPGTNPATSAKPVSVPHAISTFDVDCLKGLSVRALCARHTETGDTRLRHLCSWSTPPPCAGFSAPTNIFCHPQQDQVLICTGRVLTDPLSYLCFNARILRQRKTAAQPLHRLFRRAS